MKKLCCNVNLYIFLYVCLSVCLSVLFPFIISMGRFVLLIFFKFRIRGGIRRHWFWNADVFQIIKIKNNCTNFLFFFSPNFKGFFKLFIDLTFSEFLFIWFSPCPEVLKTIIFISMNKTWWTNQLLIKELPLIFVLFARHFLQCKRQSYYIITQYELRCEKILLRFFRAGHTQTGAVKPITKTRPCNILRFFKAVKMIIFR